MASKGFADRLYRGEANLNIIGRRNTWFIVAAVLIVLSIGSFIVKGFELGIEFAGGTEFQIPARVGTQQETSNAVLRAIQAVDPEAKVASTQRVSGNPPHYVVRASALTPPQATKAK